MAVELPEFLFSVPTALLRSTSERLESGVTPNGIKPGIADECFEAKEPPLHNLFPVHSKAIEVDAVACPW